MERLQERIIVAERALLRFEEVVNIPEPSPVERDAAIQRFEFTFEAIWKTAKNYLFDLEGIDIGSPKGVIRSCREIGLLDNQQAMAALQMVNDRNLTVHTYNEELAIDIHSRLQGHANLLRQWLARIIDGFQTMMQTSKI